MTIEIDDAGTGDLVGSAWIIFWRRETNEILSKEIPLKLYQNADFDQITKEKCKTLFEDAFNEMNVPITEEIYLCTGSIFDKARKFLQDNNYNYYSDKIEGFLQDEVENTFLKHLNMDFGIPANKLSLESGKERFFSLYNWVIQDFPRREKYVKSGFGKWQTKWKDKAETNWMKNMVNSSRDNRKHNKSKYRSRSSNNNNNNNNTNNKRGKSSNYHKKRNNYSRESKSNINKKTTRKGFLY